MGQYKISFVGESEYFHNKEEVKDILRSSLSLHEVYIDQLVIEEYESIMNKTLSNFIGTNFQAFLEQCPINLFKCHVDYYEDHDSFIIDVVEEADFDLIDFVKEYEYELNKIQFRGFEEEGGIYYLKAVGV